MKTRPARAGHVRLDAADGFQVDFKQLNGFVRVAELGNFTRAASSLGCVQSALSRQVALLEEELGLLLLRRHGRGVVLTIAGDCLLARARDILGKVDAAVNEVAHCNGVLTGRIRIAYPPPLSRQLTVPLARGLRRELPDASLSLEELQSASIQEKLRTRNVDIGIVFEAVPGPGWVVEPLMSEELCLVARAADHEGPIALRDVARMPLVIGSRPDETRQLVDSAMASIGCRALVSVEIEGTREMLRLVADGAGAAVVGRGCLPWLREAPGLRLRRIVGPAILRRAALIVRSEILARPTVRAACRVILQVVPKAPVLV